VFNPEFAQELLTLEPLESMTPTRALCLFHLFMRTGVCPLSDDQLTELMPYLAGLELSLVWEGVLFSMKVRIQWTLQFPRFRFVSTVWTCKLFMMLERPPVGDIPPERHLPADLATAIARALMRLSETDPDRFGELANEFQDEPERWALFCELLVIRASGA
jgi:hypothetical protein